jgi:cell division protein FtsW
MLIFAIFFGPEINGARRTLFVPGTGLTFQPSDLAKLALIMYMARFLSKYQDEIQDFKKGFLPILIRIIIICLLILPGSLSTAAIVFITGLIMLYMGRASFKHLTALMGIGIAAFSFLLLLATVAPKVLPRAETWQNRIVHFINPDDEQNNQVLQSKIAIATGGVFGKMPGNSTQRNFLPHPYSDFVFAIIIEEYGIAGGIIIVLLYLILLFRSLKIARHCDLKFGSFLVIGVSFLLVFQAMINMGVAVNLLPVTGQTLPFVSMGGTSFWFTCFGIGMVLSVSRALPEKQTSMQNVNYATA